jgi:hypothetical protein
MSEKPNLILKNKIKQFGNEKTRDSPFLQGDNKENGWF